MPEMIGRVTRERYDELVKLGDWVTDMYRAEAAANQALPTGIGPGCSPHSKATDGWGWPWASSPAATPT
ncbi:hypothetical protein GCM10010381_64920 [Streptomyces xantholiticus]|nr:hypothetical protein GCM10010381_64920 [Streptomyces xantholiticus]